MRDSQSRRVESVATPAARRCGDGAHAASTVARTQSGKVRAPRLTNRRSRAVGLRRPQPRGARAATTPTPSRPRATAATRCRWSRSVLPGASAASRCARGGPRREQPLNLGRRRRDVASPQAWELFRERRRHQFVELVELTCGRVPVTGLQQGQSQLQAGQDPVRGDSRGLPRRPALRSELGGASVELRRPVPTVAGCSARPPRRRIPHIGPTAAASRPRAGQPRGSRPRAGPPVSPAPRPGRLACPARSR